MNFYLSNVFNYRISVFLFIILTTIGLLDRYYYYFTPVMSGHSGNVHRPVVHQYRRFIEKNNDLGSSFTVYNGSARVIDLVGGYTDLENLLKWDKTSISQLFMVSHLVGVISVAVLVDRGHIQYNDTLGQLLPHAHKSFQMTTIRDVLTHQSRLPYFSSKLALTDYRDEPDLVLKRLLSQEEPVTNYAVLHKYSQGLLLDAIVRIVDPLHRSLAHFFTQEIAHPNQLDILVGLPRTQSFRQARLYEPDLRQHVYALGRLDFGAMWSYLRPSMSETSQKIEHTFTDLKERTAGRSSELLEIGLSSWHVFSNSDGLARLMRLLLVPEGRHPARPMGGEGSGGQMLLANEKTRQMLLTPLLRMHDEELGGPVTLTAGGLMMREDVRDKTPLYGWVDSSGQFAWAAPSLNMSMAYVTNHLRASSPSRDPISHTLIDSTLSVFL